jgi:DNA-binding transcriptional LysR family regulator
LSGFVANALQFAVIEDMDMRIQAAMDGTDLAFSAEELWLPHLASGSLVRVLEDWCPPFARFLCLTGARNKTAVLSLLIDSLGMGGDRRK